jgi:hypothetical protein
MKVLLVVHKNETRYERCAEWDEGMSSNACFLANQDDPVNEFSVFVSNAFFVFVVVFVAVNNQC